MNDALYGFHFLLIPIEYEIVQAEEMTVMLCFGKSRLVHRRIGTASGSPQLLPESEVAWHGLCRIVVGD
jgi:hypothetical protein